MTNDELLERFATYQRLRGLADRTIERREWMLSQLRASTGDKALLSVDRDDVEAFMARWPSTQSRYSARSDVRQFFRWAINRDLVEVNPTDKIDSPRLPKRAATPLTLERLEEAIVAAPPITRACILLGAYAGLRCSEIAHLAWGDVDFGRKVLTVREGKGAKDRVVPLAPRLADELQALGDRTRRQRAGDARERAVLVAAGVKASTTLAVYLEKWVTVGIEHTALHNATKANYGTLVRRHLIPAIGDVRLDQVDADTETVLCERLAAGGSAPRSIDVARSALHRALRPVRAGERVDLTTGVHLRGPVVGTNGQQVGERIRRVFRRLAIDARPHDLRHTFGTEAARASNGNVVLVAQLMGHESIQTTQRYLGWTPAGASVVEAMYAEPA